MHFKHSRVWSPTLFAESKGESFTLAAVISFFVALGAAIVNQKIGYTLPYTPFFLVPIVYVTWRAGRKFGFLLSIINGVMLASVSFASVPSDHNRKVIAILVIFQTVTYLFVTYIVDTLREMVIEESHNARVDPNTGLMNYRALEELVSKEIKRIKRRHEPLTIVYIDLDDFKELNTKFGHVQADRMLSYFADDVKHCIRDIDISARVGGDEFVVVLPGSTESGARVVLRRLKERLFAGELSKNIKFSSGIVTFYRPPSDMEELLHEADALMLKVKEQGKNAVLSKVIK